MCTINFTAFNLIKMDKKTLKHPECRYGYSVIWASANLHLAIIPSPAVYQSSREIRPSAYEPPHFFCFLGSLPFSLQLRSKGSFEKFTASWPDQALWQPQEWSQWYQGSQVVCHHRLDCHLPEKGEASLPPYCGYCIKEIVYPSFTLCTDSVFLRRKQKEMMTKVDVD